jgi:hypothetical protein
VNDAYAVIFTHKQLGNEEGTEQKKDGHTKIAKKADVVNPEMPGWIDGQVVHTMHSEDAEESEEAQSVQLWAVVANWFVRGKRLAHAAGSIRST